MENSNLKKKVLRSNLSLKKKYLYYKKINKSIFKLKDVLVKKQEYKKKLNLLLSNKILNSEQIKGLVVVYIISFSFSATNTFLYVTDSLGKLKFKYSAGLFDFKGKQKKRRIQVLRRFFRELKKLKISILQNKPVALHLNNVGFYKYFILKNLKKNIFIRLIKSYGAYSFNGCRKKKKLRK